jgi:hypothetical protein
MLATDALNVLAIAVPKFASVENRSVEVAAVIVASSVIRPVVEAALNESEPAVRLPPTLRLPVSVLSPLTASVVAETGTPEIEPPLIEAFEIEPPETMFPTTAVRAVEFGIEVSGGRLVKRRGADSCRGYR